MIQLIAGLLFLTYIASVIASTFYDELPDGSWRRRLAVSWLLVHVVGLVLAFAYAFGKMLVP